MPTDWESHYQTKDTPWDRGAPSPALEDFLAHESPGGRVLVPGCGAGHDVRAFAAAGCDVVGLDIAPSAIARAQAAPLVAHETYECADLFALPPHLRDCFDWVWEHTCFCAIDPAQRPAYVEGVHAALKTGGQLAAIFYLDPGHDRPDAGPPFEVSLGELDALFQSRFAVVREWVPERAYPGREGREWMRILRRLE